MQYDFKYIENKWQKYWKENKTYKVFEDKDKEKYYVLDMFPYPSGSNLASNKMDEDYIVHYH